MRLSRIVLLFLSFFAWNYGEILCATKKAGTAKVATSKSTPLLTIEGTETIGADQLAGSNPRPASLYQDFERLPGSAEWIDIAIGGVAPLVVCVNAGKLYQLTDNYFSWQDITPSASVIAQALGGRGENVQFKAVSIAPDQALWAVDTRGRPWQKSVSGWSCKTELACKTVSVGSQNEVVFISATGNLAFRKKDPANSKKEYFGAWSQLPDKASSITVGGDGAIFCAGAQDQTLYLFDRAKRTWGRITKPSDLGMGAAQLVAAKDQWNMLFVDFANNAWRLIPGKYGSGALEWERVSDSLQFTHLAIGVDGAMAGITTTGEVVISQPAASGTARLQAAKGGPLRANKLLALRASKNFSQQPLWTYAGNAEDPNSNANPPNDHYATMIGGPHDDDRQLVGNFFSFLFDDPEAVGEIHYGATVSVCPLFALPGNADKSGALGKDRRWWCHAKTGQQDGEVFSSLLSCQGIKDGKHLFVVTSPYGLTGPVYYNDPVCLVSLSAECKGRPLIAAQGSFIGGDFDSLQVSLSDDDDGAMQNDFYGVPSRSGNQCFWLRPINVVDVLPKIKPLAWNSMTPQLAFDQVTGLFPQDPNQPPEPPRAPLAAVTDDTGYGVIDTLRNNTAYQLQSDAGTLAPEKEKSNMTHYLFSPFSLRGFAQDPALEPFVAGKVLEVDAMWSKGVAWFDKFIDNTGQILVSFFANASDTGDIQVWFGTDFSPGNEVCVTLGGWNNVKSVIAHKDKLIAEITKDHNPMAACQPGQFIFYWISLNNGFVSVGSGMPGRNVIMSGRIPDLEPIKTVGLSTHSDPVSFTNCLLAQPLDCFPDALSYPVRSQTISIADKRDDRFYPYQTDLRARNQGAIGFSLRDKVETRLFFLSGGKGNQNEYSIVLNAHEGSYLEIERNGVTMLKIRTDELDFNVAYDLDANPKPLAFWVSLNGGVIMVGHGDIGEEPIAVWQDQFPLSGLTKIGFQAPVEPQEIVVTSFAPPVVFQQVPATSMFQFLPPFTPATPQLKVVRPLYYSLLQDREYVSLKDMIGGMNYHVVATQQQQGIYRLFLNVDGSGCPEVGLIGFEEAPEKISMRTRATVLDATAAGLKSVAQILYQANVGSVIAEDEDVEDPTTISNWILLATNLATVTAADLLQVGAANATADAAATREEIKENYRSNDTFVHTEPVKREAGTKQSVPPSALQSFDDVKNLLEQIDQFENDKNFESDQQHQNESYQDKEQDRFLRMVKFLTQIVLEIDNPYAVSDASIKSRIITYLQAVMARVSDFPDLSSAVFELLVKTQDNYTLIGDTDASDVALRARIFDVITSLAGPLLNQPVGAVVSMPALQGENLFDSRTLDSNGDGTVMFEAQGRGELLVSLCSEKLSSRNIQNRMYQFGIGTWGNLMYEIRTESLGSPSVLKHRPHMRPIFQNGNDFYPFWVRKQGATLSMGHGKVPGKSIIFSWTDPFPWEGITYVAFSSWDASINLRNIVINDQVANPKSVAQPKPKRRGAVGSLAGQAGVLTTSKGERQQKVLKTTVKVGPQRGQSSFATSSNSSANGGAGGGGGQPRRRAQMVTGSHGR